MSRFDGGSFLNRIDKAPRTIVFGAYLLPLDFYLGIIFGTLESNK